VARKKEENKPWQLSPRELMALDLQQLLQEGTNRENSVRWVHYSKNVHLPIPPLEVSTTK